MTRRALLLLLLLLPLLISASPAPPAAPKPITWTSIQQIPLNVYFRGLPPAHLHDVTTWSQITDWDPDGVWIQGRFYTPQDLLGRFEYTTDPRNAVPVACGNISK